MKIEIDDNLFNNEYSTYKKLFLEKVGNGYRKNEIENMKRFGINDDSIFITHLLGIYKGLLESGLKV